MDEGADSVASGADTVFSIFEIRRGKNGHTGDDSTNQAIIEENERMIRQRLEEENRKKAAEQENQPALENQAGNGQMCRKDRMRRKHSRMIR